MRFLIAQEWVLIIGAGLLLLLNVFPLVTIKIPLGDTSIKIDRFIGFRYVAEIAPSDSVDMEHIKSHLYDTPTTYICGASYYIAYEYLAFEWAAVIICTAVAFVIAGGKKSAPSPPA